MLFVLFVSMARECAVHVHFASQFVPFIFSWFWFGFLTKFASFTYNWNAIISIDWQRIPSFMLLCMVCSRSNGDSCAGCMILNARTFSSIWCIGTVFHLCAVACVRSNGVCAWMPLCNPDIYTDVDLRFFRVCVREREKIKKNRSVLLRFTMRKKNEIKITTTAKQKA